MPDVPAVLFDVNALVALSLTTHVHHGAAHRYLATIRGGWATCPLTEAALYRLLLNPAVSGAARRSADVTSILAGMRRDTRWSFLADTSTLTDPLIDTAGLAGHQQVTDLHLVNQAPHHGVVLATFDGAMTTWLAPADRRHVILIPA